MLTKEEFINQYCERSKITPEKLKEFGMSAHPCECGEEGCEGWQMVHKDNAETLEKLGHLKSVDELAARDKLVNDINKKAKIETKKEKREQPKPKQYIIICQYCKKHGHCEIIHKGIKGKGNVVMVGGWYKCNACKATFRLKKEGVVEIQMDMPSGVKKAIENIEKAKTVEPKLARYQGKNDPTDQRD